MCSLEKLKQKLGPLYQKACIAALDDLISGGEEESSKLMLCWDLIESAIGNKTLNAELKLRKDTLSPAEELIYQVSYLTEPPGEDSHQTSIAPLRQAVYQLRKVRDALTFCDVYHAHITSSEAIEEGAKQKEEDLESDLCSIVEVVEVVDIDPERGKMVHKEALPPSILSLSPKEQRAILNIQKSNSTHSEKFRAFKEMIEELQIAHPEIMQDPQFERYKASVNAILEAESSISESGGLLQFTNMTSLLNLEILQDFLSTSFDNVFQKLKKSTLPKMTALVEDLEEAKEISVELNETALKHSERRTGDVFLEDRSTYNLLMHRGKRELGVFALLKSKGIMGLEEKAIGRFTYAGIIRNDGKEIQLVEIATTPPVFNYRKQLISTYYRPDFLKLLTQEGITLCRTTSEWKDLSDGEFASVLEGLFASTMEEVLDQNKKAYEDLTFDSTRAAGAVVLAATEKLPRPIQTAVNSLFYKVIAAVEKKTNPEAVFDLKSINERKKTFCSEFVVVVLRKTFQEFNKKLQEKAGQAVSIREFIPPEIKPEAIHPGRLNYFLGACFMKIEPPLWQRLLLGTQLEKEETKLVKQRKFREVIAATVKSISNFLGVLWKKVTGAGIETLPGYKKIVEQHEDLEPALKNFIKGIKENRVAKASKVIASTFEVFEKLCNLKNSVAMTQFREILESKLNPLSKLQALDLLIQSHDLEKDLEHFSQLARNSTKAWERLKRVEEKVYEKKKATKGGLDEEQGEEELHELQTLYQDVQDAKEDYEEARSPKEFKAPKGTSET